MSDKASAAATFTTADGTVMTKGDIDFLMACISNTTGGQLVIDPLKVAAALNMKNPKSVGNRVGQMKKKFGFPIACSSKAATSGAGHAGNSATSGPAVPKTSNKNRVKKPAAKKAPAKGGKKAKKDESEDDGEQEAEQEIEQEIEQEPVSGAEDEEATVSSPLAVKELKLSTPELEEAVFGKADPKEEGEEA